MGRRYKTPPLIEALCEFRFDSGAQWDNTVFGLFYERVRPQFQNKRTARHLTVNLEADAGSTIVQQQIQATDRMQFYSENEKTLFQVGENLLVINQLAPYQSWDEFLPLVEMAFGHYLEVANPKAVTRIGMRYINQIKLPFSDETRSIELEDFFNVYPFLGPDFPKDHGPFKVSVQYPFDIEEHIARNALNLNLASEKQQEGKYTIRLDLDYFTHSLNSTDLTQITSWANAAHSRIENVFEASIKDSLRAIFGETD